MTDLLDALEAAGAVLEQEVDGRPVRLTSLDRVMWPRNGATKRDMLRYYIAIAPRLLPHVVDRPLTLARYPEGVDGKNWFQTMCPHAPEWVSTHAVDVRGRGGVTRNYCVVHDLAGLLWAVNLGTIEFHPLLAKAETFDEPELLVFDLDPGPPAALVEACALALDVRDLLAAAPLTSYVKTSGGIGLHVMVPLDRAHSYAQTKAFARDLARLLARRHPDRAVAVPDRSARSGRVFIDWSQNDPNKSIIAAYSMRALPWPAASAPITWSEVEHVAATGSVEALPLEAERVLQRAALSDPWAALFVSKGALRDAHIDRA